MSMALTFLASVLIMPSRGTVYYANSTTFYSKHCAFGITTQMN